MSHPLYWAGLGQNHGCPSSSSANHSLKEIRVSPCELILPLARASHCVSEPHLLPEQPASWGQGVSSLDFQDIAQGLVQGQGRTELTRCAEGQGWHSERHLAHTKEEPRGAKTWAGVTQGRGPWRLHLSQPEREGEKNDRTLNSPPNSLQNQLPLGPIHTHEAGSRYRLCLFR